MGYSRIRKPQILKRVRVLVWRYEFLKIEPCVRGNAALLAGNFLSHFYFHRRKINCLAIESEIFLSQSANGVLRTSFTTPSIELKKRIFSHTSSKPPGWSPWRRSLTAVGPCATMDTGVLDRYDSSVKLKQVFYWFKNAFKK